MIDGAKLAVWVRAQHEKQRHAMILAEEYRPEDVIRVLKTQFPAAVPLSSVDLILDNLWISARPILGKIPKATPTVGICIIRKGNT